MGEAPTTAEPLPIVFIILLLSLDLPIRSPAPISGGLRNIPAAPVRFALKKHIKKKSSYFCNYLFSSDPGGSRTHDLRLRRPLLYPTELLDQHFYGLAVQIYSNFAGLQIFVSIFSNF